MQLKEDQATQIIYLKEVLSYLSENSDILQKEELHSVSIKIINSIEIQIKYLLLFIENILNF